MRYKVGSITDLKKEKNIYCFGAGKIFDSFMKESARFHLEQNVRAVVDSNAGALDISCKNINGIEIPVISLEQMLDDIKEWDCILITTAYFEEIIQQLEKISKLNFISYYLYFIVHMEQHDYDRLQIAIPECLSACPESIIPKTIHYCWFGRKELPDKYRKYIESWKKYCPDYEITEWNESNYDVHKNRYCSQAYAKRKWAFVSDYARLDIILKYGGVYLDTDVELLKNIDEMLKNEAFCGFESEQYVNFGLGFGAKKDHAIVNEIKDYYDNMQFVLENGQINQINCPVIQTEVMKKHKLICNGKFQVIDGMAVYPERILCGMSPFSFRIEKKPVHTYAIHHFEGSWLDGDDWKDWVAAYEKRGKKSEYYVYP